jgi:hypothetical protein
MSSIFHNIYLTKYLISRLAQIEVGMNKLFARYSVLVNNIQWCSYPFRSWKLKNNKISFNCARGVFAMKGLGFTKVSM